MVAGQLEVQYPAAQVLGICFHLLEFFAPFLLIGAGWRGVAVAAIAGGAAAAAVAVAAGVAAGIAVAKKKKKNQDKTAG